MTFGHWPSNYTELHIKKKKKKIRPVYLFDNYFFQISQFF